MSSLVLYDVPGPKSRRRVLIGSIVGFGVILVLIGVVLLKLDANDQLDPQRWAIITDTRAGVPQALGRGLLATLQVAAVGAVLSILLGSLLAIGRLSDHRAVRIPVAVVVEFFRAVPLLVVIFAVFIVPPGFGVDVSPYAALIIGLTLYNMAVIAEIVRAGILSLDRGQSEAAYGVGLRKWQVMVYILLPQAYRRMLPVLIAQLVVLLKDSSLGFIISYVELLKQAQGLVNFFAASYGDQYTFQIYVAAALTFIIVNVILSSIARYVDRRLARGKQAAPVDESALATGLPEQMGVGGPPGV